MLSERPSNLALYFLPNPATKSGEISPDQLKSAITKGVKNLQARDCQHIYHPPCGLRIPQLLHEELGNNKPALRNTGCTAWAQAFGQTHHVMRKSGWQCTGDWARADS